MAWSRVWRLYGGEDWPKVGRRRKVQSGWRTLRGRIGIPT